MISFRRVLGAVGLVVIGSLIAFAVPNFLTALNRSRQKRSMAGVRDWAVALENARGHQMSPMVGYSDRLILANSELPRTDGWGTPYRIRMGNAHTTVSSAGRDAVFQVLIRNGATTSFDEDIVYSDGAFIQYPEGI